MIVLEGLIDDVFMEAINLEGYVQSVFENAVNLEFVMPDGEKRLFTLISEGNSLLPDSAIIPRNSKFIFNALLVGQKVNKKENRFFFENKSSLVLSISKRCYCVFKLKPELIKITRIHSMYQKLKEFLLFSQNPSGFSNLPLQLQNDVQSFATAIIKSDVKNMQESFECLVGLGNGLTPTCDDAMLGVLGVAFGTFENGLLIGGKEQYLKLTNSLICLLLQEHKTTKVSEKYLKCAFRGAFSVDMSNLVKSLFCGEMSLFEHSMKNIADIGHTSGIDTLTGAQIFIECFNNI